MAYLYPCECGREYVIAASFAGSKHQCLCGINMTIPRLGLLSALEVAPEPENKTIELLDERKLNYENEEYVLKKFSDEYESFVNSRSKSALLSSLEPYQLHSFEVDQTYDTMDRCIRRKRRQEGWKGIIIGAITIPVLIVMTGVIVMVWPRWKLIALCVVGLVSVIGIFFRGWYTLTLSGLPNKE